MQLSSFKLYSHAVFAFFSEENICESCHTTILPSGGFSMYLYSSILILYFYFFKAVIVHFCVSDMAKPFSVVVFHCRHMFHKECLPSSGSVSNFLTVHVPLYASHMFYTFFPHSYFRFLVCSFVTSAVRRGEGQEVESWR